MNESTGNKAIIQGLIPIIPVNEETNPEHIAGELDELHVKGIVDFAIQPDGRSFCNRPNLWMEILGWYLETAKTQGMHIWINHAPERLPQTEIDGLIERYPELARKSLTVQITPRDEIDPTFFQPGQFLVAGRLQGGLVTKTRILQDMHALRSLDETWLVFNCHIKRDFTFPDLLSKVAVDKLIDDTYNEYYRRFESDFGETLKAVMTSEMHIRWQSPAKDKLSIPYTEDLFSSFEKRCGYSAVENIPFLFCPSDASAAFRADFWEHIAYLFNTNYHGILADWCRKNGLLYTGCDTLDNHTEHNLQFDGDPFEVARLMDIPCAGYTREPGHRKPHAATVECKIASSLAHATGKETVIGEFPLAFGLEAGDTAAMKTADTMFALGVNSLVGKMAPLTSQADPNFKAHVTQLSELLMGGKHLCRVLVLYPISGLYAGYQPDRKTHEWESITSFLNSLLISLAQRQLDYDLVDFATLSSAKIEKGHINLGNESYEVLLVPYTGYMKPSEYEAIGQIAKQVNTCFFYRSMNPAPANVPSQSNSVQFVATEELPGFMMRLRHAVDDGIHINGTGREDIQVLQREKDGKIITFLVNQSDYHRKMTARFTGEVKITRVDLETGAEQPMESQLVSQKTETALRFDPKQSMLLIMEAQQS